MPHFPLILIEVLSLDSFKRFRTEGYTYVTVPNKPGIVTDGVCNRQVFRLERLKSFNIRT